MIGTCAKQPLNFDYHPGTMKGAFIVIGITFVVGIAIGVFGFISAKRQTLEVRELFTAFTYFLEDNDARFPAGEAQLRAAAFVQEQPDGSLLLVNRPDDRFRRGAAGYPLKQLERFHIPWGVDLASLTIDPLGITRDPDGQEVLIISRGASIDILRRFTRDLLKVAEEIRAKASGATEPNVVQGAPSL